jgi:hypothetical protein
MIKININIRTHPFQVHDVLEYKSTVLFMKIYLVLIETNKDGSITVVYLNDIREPYNWDLKSLYTYINYLKKIDPRELPVEEYANYLKLKNKNFKV